MAEDSEDRREEFGAWLRRQREERGFGIDRAARVAGVAATTLRRIEMGDVPSIDVARQIARGLELDLSEVFRRVGYPLGLWSDRRLEPNSTAPDSITDKLPASESRESK